MLVFGSFRLDPLNQELWRGPTLVRLPPKTFAMLSYLVERPLRLVTKQELLDALWQDVHVGDAVLKTHLKEIRQALEDSVKAPRFIQTVHRRGYRFVAPVERELKPPARDRTESPTPGTLLVGRAEPLARLADILEVVRAGRHGVVFITGEPGIGKTSLVNGYFDPLATQGDVWLARGQCIEQYGTGATLLPVLEALARTCRAPGGPRVIEALRRHAPTWLVRMPELIDETTLSTLQRTAGVATPERMLRELAQALSALAELRPVVLLLEDLHWADYSTLDLVSYLARRTDLARVLLVCTYRSIELRLSAHPLRAIVDDLSLREQCETLELRHLSEGDVGEYLATRFLGNEFPLELARITQRRTSGNPLFVTRVLDDWIKQGQLSRASGGWRLCATLEVLARSVPASIMAMIERETDRLSELERSVLEVASVVGNEFSAAGVAAALSEDLVRVDELCSRWRRQGRFLQPGGALGDPAEPSTYQFIHALYHQVIYLAIGPERRARLHQFIGERAERLQLDEPQGALLATHFERSHDLGRALRYRRLAGDQALGRSAYRQAVDHFRAAIALCARLTERESRALELELQVSLGVPLAMTLGYAAPDVEACYRRAACLSEQLGSTPQSFPVMSGLATFYLMSGRYVESERIGEEFLSLATRQREDGAALEANLVLGTACLFMAEFQRSVSHLERAIALYDPERQKTHRFVYQQDAYVLAKTYLAWAEWLLGHPDRALEHVQEASHAARGVGEPYNVAVASFNLGLIHHWRREPSAARSWASNLSALCMEHGFSFLLAAATELQGAALVEQGEGERGLSLLRQGWAAHAATGAELGGTYWRAVLADACMRAGVFDEARELLLQALVVVGDRSERIWESELYRLHGELCRQAPEHAPALPQLGGGAPDPERAFVYAIDLARQRGAGSHELRAALGLARLWSSRGRNVAARELLAGVIGRFDSGQQTADLREAHALAGALAAAATRAAPRAREASDRPR